MKRLEDNMIEEAKRTPTPRYGMTADGYTKRSGAPTLWLVRLKGEKRWRRLMCWCFSNAGTLFLRIKGECLVTSEYEQQALYDANSKRNEA